MSNNLYKCVYLLASLLIPLREGFASPAAISQFIKVDQFGYRTTDQKIAVIGDPQIGYNAPLSYTPGTAASQYQLRNWSTDAVVYSGTLVPWHAGAIHDQSGDKVWWFDFSGVTTPGAYYVFDKATNKGSVRFEINNNVYQNVMKAAVRMFYYQRAGFAKVAPFVDPGFADGASHLGPLQDLDCRLVNNGSIASSRNLSGGWYDAGDYNKYVNYAWDPVLDLLLAYEQKPGVWVDNYNIPESGNGIPDLLDEVKFELDWLLKMQNADGSVLSVVGTEKYASASPPFADKAPRKYGPSTTQASFSAAGMFALASVQFNAVGQKAYAGALKNAAIKAWNWAVAHPGVIFHNNDGVTNFLAAGDQEGGDPKWSTGRRKFAAAVYLYAATGNTTYRSFIDSDYSNNLGSTFGSASDNTAETDAALYYSKTKGATLAVKNAIVQIYTQSLLKGVNNLPSVRSAKDAYRAYISSYDWDMNVFVSIHDWGSNVLKAHQAINYLNMIQYGLDTTNASNYVNAASGYVHYFHGVNPNAKTYLTNMATYGAENSVKSIYHAWFTDESALWDEVGVSNYGPAPGYVPGGPNQNYAKDASYRSVDPNFLLSEQHIVPEGQPPQKAWRDFNESWPLNSWTVTEPQLFYQAAYVRMLSKFL